MLVIGLSGKAGSGKDTVGATLQSILEDKGLTCTKLSFAAKLKDALSMFFGWDRERLEHDFDYKEGVLLDDCSIDPACRLLNMSRRQAMQKFGTDAVRNGLHPDAWVIILRLAVERGEYDHIDVGFLTDCRFKNELQFVRDMGGVLIKIHRHGEKETLTEHTQHASETDWLDWNTWDFDFDNNINPEVSKEENLAAMRRGLEFFVEEIIKNKAA